jgi:hypothetical protein
MTPETLPRALRAIVGLVIGAVMLVLAIFFFAFFLAVAAIGVAILVIRFWWLGRKLRRMAAQAVPAASASTVIEGEYEVVRERGAPGAMRDRLK